MTNSTYELTVGGKSFDLSAKAALPVGKMTNAELAAVYNSMCTLAKAVPDFDPKGDKTKGVVKFKDSETGKKRIAALHSSLVAFAKGQKAGATRAERAATRATNAADRKLARDLTKADGRGRKSTYTAEQVIKKLTPENPKRAGSIQAGHWDALKDGMTVAQYQEAIGRAEANNRLLWDAKRGLISVN